jgi:hypothetical protein
MPEVMFPPVMLSPLIIVSFCAYALEIPVVSKNPVVDNAMVAPMIANAVNTTKIARFVLDDMFDPIENSNVYKYCLMASYRTFNFPYLDRWLNILVKR